MKITDIIKGWYRTFIDFAERFKPGKTAVRGAAYGMLIICALILIAFSFQFLPYIGILPVLAIIIMMAAAALLSGLLIRYLTVLLSLIPKIIVFAVMASLVIFSFQFGLSLKSGLPILLYFLIFSALSGGAVWLTAKKGWTSFSETQRVKTGIFGGLGFLGIFVVFIWLLLPGKVVEMPEIAALSGYYLPDHIEQVDPSVPGIFEVSKLSYGSGKDKRRKEFAGEVTILTDSVDGSLFIDGWKGFSGKMRSRYFGFDSKSLPLNGTVWHPEGTGPFPLVLIVHGNHLAQDYSDPGYEYLGDLLASRGYILASVDQNFLNGSYFDFFGGLKSENAARGWLLLEHLKLWENWNSDSLNIFYGKVDIENISLIGHSRGGEAVAHAALFNTLPYYPDNSKARFDYNFNIRSIIAIAPVDGQYQPGGIRTPLKDINYFVLQGSHDADVQSYMGMSQYERVTFSEGFDGFKAGLYIYNANHGQFNQGWGRRDYSFPGINLVNIKQLIDGDDQRKIASIYISAFLEATLSGNSDYLELFKDYRTGREWLPETIYLNRFDQSDMQYICRYSEDMDITTTSLPGGFIESDNLTVWREQMVKLKWHDKETRAVFIGWNNGVNDSLVACYSVNFPVRSLNISENSSLFFSLADTSENSNPQTDEKNDENDLDGDSETAGDNDEQTVNRENQSNQENDNQTVNESENGDGIPEDEEDEEPEEKSRPIDFSIELADSNGETIRFNLHDHAFLQPRLEVKLHKLEFMKTNPGSEHLYHFFYFPMRRFTTLNENFSPDDIIRITFIFDKTEDGVIILDNLGFMPSGPASTISP
jgi:pimeloyl-ACP methyl ester carboxylesterase